MPTKNTAVIGKFDSAIATGAAPMTTAVQNKGALIVKRRLFVGLSVRAVILLHASGPLFSNNTVNHQT